MNASRLVCRGVRGRGGEEKPRGWRCGGGLEYFRVDERAGGAWAIRCGGRKCLCGAKRVRLGREAHSGWSGDTDKDVVVERTEGAAVRGELELAS